MGNGQVLVVAPRRLSKGLRRYQQLGALFMGADAGRKIYGPEGVTGRGTVAGTKTKGEKPKKGAKLTDKQFSHKMSGWIGNGLDESHFKLLYELIHTDKMIEHIATPYPISIAFAKHVREKYSKLLIGEEEKEPFTFMDPMTGSGADTYAIAREFGSLVNITAMDLDTTKLKLLQAICRRLKDEPRAHNVAEELQKILITTEQGDVSDLFTQSEVPPVNMIYLDPMWPGSPGTYSESEDEDIWSEYKKHANSNYMIGQHEMFEFITKMFEKNPHLVLIAAKIYNPAYLSKNMKQKIAEIQQKKKLKVDHYHPEEVRYDVMDGENLKTEARVYGGDIGFLFVHK